MVVLLNTLKEEPRKDRHVVGLKLWEKEQMASERVLQKEPFKLQMSYFWWLLLDIALLHD